VVSQPTLYLRRLLFFNPLSEKAKVEGLGVRIFHLLAHAAPATPLPREVLLHATSLEDEATGGKRLTNALHELNQLGLVMLDKKLQPSTHRLLQEFARLQVDAERFNADANKLEEVVGNLAGKINKAGLPKAMEPLLPHLQVVAERAAACESENAGWLFNEIGYHLKQIANYAQARAAYERALYIFEQVLSENHPNVATLVNNLGTVYQDLGDLPAARAAYERALRIDEHTFGPDHPNVAIRISNLGNVYQDLGDLPAARAAYERALRIDEQAFGPDHPHVATDVNNLGSVYEAEGNLGEARAAYERALRIMEQYAPNNLNTQIVRENLAQVVAQMEATDAARSG
jgi:tetratricopeptide (TPR) repeat protein